MRRPLLLLSMAAVIGCGSPPTPPEPPPAAWSAPSDWVTVRARGAAIQLAIPPWLVLENDQGSIFAKEPTDARGQEMALWAQGPQGIEDVPIPGQDLAAWVRERLASNGGGEPVVTPIDLPAGRGVRYEIVEGLEGPEPWRTVVFAVRVPSGVAWLQVTGPASSWPGHVVDIDRIALLFRVG